MIIAKTKEEIELMREAALVVSKTLGMLASEVKPGVTTLYLDKLAEDFIRGQGAIPGFLGLYDFPNTLCMSPNAQVVHGIPNDTPLKEGDIISIDCGAIKNEFYGDHAYTFAIGEIAPEVQKLLRITKESLYMGIRELKIGKRTGDVGYAIQQYCVLGFDYGRTQRNQAKKDVRKNGFVTALGCGYDEYYIIDQRTQNVDTELEVDETMTKAKIARNFSKFQSTKKQSRQMLNKFVDLVK